MYKLKLIAIVATSLTLLSAAPAQAGVTRVRAEAGWHATGVQLVAGVPYVFDAHGSAVTGPASIFHGPGGFGAVSGPDGQTYLCGDFESPGFVCQDAGSSFGALVGRIGPSGTPFRVGSSLRLSAPTTGVLYLAVNDFEGYHFDNLGGFAVTVAATAGPVLPTAATFATNFHFNCRPDHNIGVPAGKRLVLTGGWGATTKGLVEQFLGSIEMRAEIAGVALEDPMRYWLDPYLQFDGTLWIARWAYDTGIVSTFGRSYSIDIAVDVTHAVNDGFTILKPAQNPVMDSDGACSVTAF